jgi:hypothetical protein
MARGSHPLPHLELGQSMEGGPRRAAGGGRAVGGGSAAGLGGGLVVVDAVAELGGEVGGLFIGDLQRWGGGGR